MEYGVGLYQPGDASLLMWERDTPRDGTRRGIICLPGHGGDATQYSPLGQGVTNKPGAHAAALARAGYLVYSIDAAEGVIPWGNQAFLDAFDAAYADLISARIGARVDGIGLLCWSMGGLDGLNAAKRHLADIKAMALWAPATDLAHYHANPAYTAEIDDAYSPPFYGSGGYVLNAVGHDPVVDAAVFRGAGIPAIFYQGTADLLVTPALTNAYLAAANEPLFELATLQGGTHAPFGYISETDTVRWWLENMPPT